MYTTTVKTENNSDSNLAKYTVADILSSMANGGGEPATSPFSEASFMSGILTGTTPTLTPTTIASIEQTFIELQSLPVTSSGGVPHGVSSVPAPTDLSQHQAGFVPPVVDPRTAAMPIKTESYDYYTTDDSKSSDTDWMPPVVKRSRPDVTATQSVITYGQPANTSTVTVQTGATQRKTPGRKAKHEVLSPGEESKRRIRRERNKLAAAKCRQRRVDHTNELLGETEDLEEIRAKLESEVQQLQQQKEQLEFLLEAHKPMCTVAKLIVKPDPELSTSESDPTGIAPATSNVPSFSMQTARPTSLPLTVQDLSVSEATGVNINTPSKVFGQLGLDTLMEGHSGLTPITGAPSCASEVKRQSSDSSPSDNSLSSPTRLMAL